MVDCRQAERGPGEGRSLREGWAARLGSAGHCAAAHRRPLSIPIAASDSFRWLTEATSPNNSIEHECMAETPIPTFSRTPLWVVRRSRQAGLSGSAKAGGGSTSHETSVLIADRQLQAEQATCSLCAAFSPPVRRLCAARTVPARSVILSAAMCEHSSVTSARLRQNVELRPSFRREPPGTVE